MRRPSAYVHLHACMRKIEKLLVCVASLPDFLLMFLFSGISTFRSSAAARMVSVIISLFLHFLLLI